jgi:hypothetical protein
MHRYDQLDTLSGESRPSPGEILRDAETPIRILTRSCPGLAPVPDRVLWWTRSPTG